MTGKEEGRKKLTGTGRGSMSRNPNINTMRTKPYLVSQVLAGCFNLPHMYRCLGSGSHEHRVLMYDMSLVRIPVRSNFFG